jgi:hypothetical protein
MRSQYIAALAIVVLGRPAPVGRAVPPVTAGTVSGRVTFTGTPPRMKPVDMSKEPTCAAQHATPASTENVVTGLRNALQYVVVYVSDGDQAAVTDTDAVRFDLHGCQYVPHVAAMQVNQPLEIRNDDGVLHNVQVSARVNRGWNRGQAPSTSIHATFAKAEVIAVKCQEHPWMHGYFVVINTSHYAVTGHDGAFSLQGLPPGTYTVTAWQEQLGTQSQVVTIRGGETKALNFVFRMTPN